jgi:hypothetical protein
MQCRNLRFRKLGEKESATHRGGQAIASTNFFRPLIFLHVSCALRVVATRHTFLRRDDRGARRNFSTLSILRKKSHCNFFRMPASTLAFLPWKVPRHSASTELTRDRPISRCSDAFVHAPVSERVVICDAWRTSTPPATKSLSRHGEQQRDVAELSPSRAIFASLS